MTHFDQPRSHRPGPTDPVTVSNGDLNSVLLILDDLADVLAAAATAEPDRHRRRAMPGSTLDRVDQIRHLRSRLRDPADDDESLVYGAGEWFTDLCWMLHDVPLMDLGKP